MPLIQIEHYHHHECAPAALAEITAGINSLWGKGHAACSSPRAVGCARLSHA